MGAEMRHTGLLCTSVRVFDVFTAVRHTSFLLLITQKGAPHRSDSDFASEETKRMIGCTLEAMLFDARIETDESVISLRHLQLNENDE